MKTFLIKGIFTLALSFIILGCSSNSSDQLTVGYLYPAKFRARFVKEGNYMIERLKQLGYKTMMVDADDNDALQIENGMKMLDKVDLIVIAPVNGNTIAPVVREANKRNIPIIAYNRLINNVEYDLFFTGDNDDNGRIFCDAALKMYPQGNYVILAGDRFDRNGVELKHSIDSILAPKVKNNDITIVYESYVENWNKENAKFELEQVIQSHGTDIDVVMSCSDPMGIGAAEILKKYGMEGRVFVSGQDALLPAVRNIYSGVQHITIYHPHKVLGYAAADLADKLLQGEQPEDLANAKTFNGKGDIPTVKEKSVAVTKDNLEKELIESGEYTWDEIMQ